MPGATLGTRLDRQDESDRQSPSPAAADEKPASAESATTPSDPVGDDAPEAASPSGTATGSAWSGGAWAWSTPSPALTDDAATSAVTGADDDDWPSRYSWLEDDETGKPEDPDDLPSASSVSPETTTSPETPASPESAAVRPARDTGDDVKTTSDRESNEERGTADDAGDGPSAETADDAGLVTVLPGVPRYHEGNCILIRFMPKDEMQRLTIGAAEKLGCTPCTACQTED